MIDYSDLLTTGIEQLVGPEAVFLALMAIGLNVHFGYTGLLNFGQIGFALVGAYGMGISVTELDFPLPLGIVFGMLCGVALALVLGIPTLRLRADYLAIVTIAASEILRLITRSTSSTDLTGGTQGLTGFSKGYTDLNPFDKPVYEIWGLQFRSGTLWAMCVGWGVVALCLLLVWALARSPWGRLVKAIREDEDAARALGKNVFLAKMQALVLGGVFGALGGAMYGLAVGSLTPDFYSSDRTFIAYGALILGGAARVVGPVIGAMLLTAILAVSDLFLRQASTGDDPLLDFIDVGDIGAIRFVLVGLVLALLIVFRPQGILGDRREVTLDAR